MKKLMTFAEVKSEVDRKAAMAVGQHKAMAVSPGGGVVIRISPQGKATYTVVIRKRERKLGGFEEMTLAEARRQAGQARADDRAAAETSPLFGTFWREYRAMKASQVSAKRMSNIDSYYKVHLKSFNGLKLAEITPERVIRRLSDAGVAQNYKAALFRTLNECVNYAVALGKLKSSPLSDYVLSGFNIFKRKAAKGKDFVSAAELGDVFRKLSGCRPILKFMLLYQALAMARPNEARLLKWKHVDYGKGMILMPAEDMKARREHAVMLTTQIRSLLEVVKPFSDCKEYVFWASMSGRPMGSSALSQMMRLNGLAGIMTPHGFRYSASTWLHESGFNRDDIERCLAHKRITGVEAVYSGSADYSKGMLAVLQAWDDYLFSVLPDDWKAMLSGELS